MVHLFTYISLLVGVLVYGQVKVGASVSFSVCGPTYLPGHRFFHLLTYLTVSRSICRTRYPPTSFFYLFTSMSAYDVLDRLRPPAQSVRACRDFYIFD